VVKEGKITTECLLPLVTTDSTFYCPLSMAALLHRKPASMGTNCGNCLAWGVRISADGYLKLLQQRYCRKN